MYSGETSLPLIKEAKYHVELSQILLQTFNTTSLTSILNAMLLLSYLRNCRRLGFAQV